MNEPEHSASGNADWPRAPWPRGPLYEPLRALLVAELGELTLSLDGLRARISEDPTTLESDQEVLQRSRQTGWLFGVLAAAAGEDILLARRERAGLTFLVDRVRALLVAAGRDLTVPTEPLTTIEVAGADWKIPWAVASALFVAGFEEDSTLSEWSFRHEDSQYVLRGYSEVGERLAELAAELTRSLPGSSFRTSPTSWLLSFESPPTP